MTRRRFFAPEVVQSSAMDCGPASLKCLLEGHGISVGYDRLREACQTSLDGTSIDSIEEAALDLGLEADQIILPVDHVFLPEANALPALLVVSNAMGVTHFLVVWRRMGRWMQVMDPAVGRRFLTCDSLFEDIYRHISVVSKSEWRDWAGGDEFQSAVDARLRRAGTPRAHRANLRELAQDDSTWKTMAALDAATRLVSRMSISNLPGQTASALLRGLVEEAVEAADPLEVIPVDYWSVRPVPEDPKHLHFHCAVLMRVLGATPCRQGRPERGSRSEDLPATTSAQEKEGADESRGGENEPQIQRDDDDDGLDRELQAALDAPERRPFAELTRWYFSDSKSTGAALLGGLFLAAATLVLEILIFRGLLDLSGRLALPGQRVGAVIFLVTFLLLAGGIEVATWWGVLTGSRRLEMRFRVRLREKLGTLTDRYFRSRLASDMAERVHNVHQLREFPKYGARAFRLLCQIVFTTLGLLWLAPSSAPIALLALAGAIVLPIAVQPLLRERDLRAKTHSGAMSRFYLDALLGLVPTRSHGGEDALIREQEGLLLDWYRALIRREKTKLVIDAVQAGFGYGMAVWLVFHHLSIHGATGEVLLLTFWALQLQMLGQELTLVGEHLPSIYNVALRLLEPLGGLEEREPSASRTTGANLSPRTHGGMALCLRKVDVFVGGQQILHGIDLEIDPGQKVAVVGSSGAGKSTLVGLFLGWHVPRRGVVRIDDQTLDEVDVDALRCRTAWLDPSIQIWNESLLENLLYGAPEDQRESAGAVAAAARLDELLPQLPRGMSTPLGEGGALVSGGEGQRVRLARAMSRRRARLVLLDEPFRGLDRELRIDLTTRAFDWWPDATMLYISHHVDETLDFDRVLVIRAGRLVEDGTPTDLMKSESIYRSMVQQAETARRELLDPKSWRRMSLEEGKIVAEDRNRTPDLGEGIG